MTLVQDIIDRGYREGNLIPAGQSADDTQRTEGLNVLNGFLRSLFGFELGQWLRDVTIPYPGEHHRHHSHTFGADEDFYANVRFLSKITSAKTVKLDPHPEDGAQIAYASVGATANLTIDAQDRLIESSTALELTPLDSPRHWFYRADIGTWVLVQTLALTDEQPFPPEFDDFLISAVSKRLQPRHSKELAPGTEEIFKEGMKILRARFNQSPNIPIRQGPGRAETSFDPLRTE